MSEHGILKYFRPILGKKDPPEEKEFRTYWRYCSKTYLRITESIEKVKRDDMTLATFLDSTHTQVHILRLQNLQ